jgi:hypothetical protein
LIHQARFCFIHQAHLVIFKKKGGFDKSNPYTRWIRPLHKMDQTPAQDKSNPYTRKIKLLRLDVGASFAIWLKK